MLTKQDIARIDKHLDEIVELIKEIERLTAKEDKPNVEDYRGFFGHGMYLSDVMKGFARSSNVDIPALLAHCVELKAEVQLLQIDKAVHDSTVKQMGQKMLEVAKLTSERDRLQAECAALKRAISPACKDCTAVYCTDENGIKSPTRKSICKMDYWEFDYDRFKDGGD